MNRREFLSSAVIASAVTTAGCVDFSSGGSDTCSVDERQHETDSPATGTFGDSTSETLNASFHASQAVSDASGSDVASGDIYWRTRFPGPPSGSAGVAIVGGTVCFGGERLYGVGQATGEVEWCRSPGIIRPSAPVLHEGTLIVGEKISPDEDGGVRALDPASGDDRWRNTEVGSVGARPTVANGTVFLSGSIENQTISAVDLESGDLRWKETVEGAARSPPVPSSETLLVRTQSRLLAVDQADGSIEWQTDAGGSVRSPVVADGTVFTQTGPATFAALDAATGDENWSVTNAEERDLDMHACVDDETVYVALTGEGRDEVVALSQADGTERWRATAERTASRYDVLGTPDSLFVASEDGMAALRTTDGTVRWSRGFPTRSDEDVVYSGTPAAFGVTSGALYALTGSGDLFALAR